MVVLAKIGLVVAILLVIILNTCRVAVLSSEARRVRPGLVLAARRIIMAGNAEHGGPQ